MSNTKSHIYKNISIVTSLLIAISIVFGFIGNTSNAAKIKNGETVGELIKLSQNKEEWYALEAPKSIGAKVKSGQDAPVNQVGGMCIHPNGHYFTGTTYKVVNIFDINNDTKSNVVKVYSEKNKNGVEYSVSNKNVKPILMLAYLARVAEEKGETWATTNATAKDAMTRIMWETTYVNQMRKVGLSNYIQGQGYGYTGYNKYINEAEAFATQAQKQGAIETQALEVSMEESEKNKITATTVNGKTFIGPYRVNLTGGAKIGEITINNSEKAVGIAEKIDTNAIKSVDSVKHHKPFYVVINNSTTKIESIKIKSKTALVSTKARIVIVSGGASQNFIIYNGEKTNTEVEKTLPLPKTGKLEIQKVDQFNDSTISLKDIEFKVYAENKGWVKKDGQKINFVPNYDDAEKFKTDAKGKITIENLPSTEQYRIYETGLPTGLQDIYQLEETTVPGKTGKVKAQRVWQVDSNGNRTSGTYKVTPSQPATVTAVNNRSRTDVYVHKIDGDTGKPLNGYEFRLYRIDGNEQGWVRAENNTVLEKDTYTKDFNDAKVAKLVTVNGITPTLKGLPVGKYELYETKLGENGEAYDLGKFKKDNKEYDGKLVDTQEVKANTTGVFPFEEKNRQVFIKITGKVFEDTLQGKNKQSRDGEYNSEDDKLIEGIEVTLVDRITKQEISTFTNAKGEYTFDKVRIRESDNSEKADYLNRYYVKFKYDGFIYQSTAPSKNEVKKFNDDGTINTTTSKAFETETTRGNVNNQFKEVTGKGQKLSNGVELKYNKSNDIVTLENTSKLVETNTGIKVEGKTDFEVNATVLGNLLQAYYDKLKETQDVVTEISHIDLGVYRREMPNLSLEKDVYNAEVSVNGYKYTYMYNQKIVGNDAIETTTGVDFDNDYRLPIYRADAEKSEGANALNATVTYKIKLQNSSTNLYTTVNGLNEWYSKDYSIAKDSNEKYEIYLSNDPAEKTFDDNNRLQLKREPKTTNPDQNSEYNRTPIEFAEPIKLTPDQEGNTKYVYIKLNVNEVANIYNKNINLENFVEINEYTTYSDKEFKNLYAAIDTNSIPGSMIADRFAETDEDDSDNAPGLHLVEAAERTISGTVFEDGAISFGAGKERIGDGKFEDDETKIAGVEVSLLQYNGSEWKIVGTTTTDASGNFSFKGFMAGTYKVQYKWGNDKYKVENYKGTIFVNKDRANDPNWIKEENPRYSDAMDDYNLRVAIDQKALYNRDTAGYDDLSKMISETPDFAIGIEKEEYTEAPGENGYTYNVSNVDFGIIERPRQAMEINKNLKSILLTTNDGAQIVNASIKEDGTLDVKTGEKWVTGGKDYLWVQVDKSITQGLNAEMGYNITVSNVSEIDYDNEDYYKYGVKNGDQITMNLRAEAIYDYCKGALLSSENTTEWETVKPGDYRIDTTTGDTITEENFKEQFARKVNEDGTINESYSWESSHSETKEIYTEWLEQMATTRTTDIRKVKLDGREILKYNGTKLTRAMAPGESETAEIKLSKELANGNDIRFDNDAEITNITFETAARTGSKPSAYTSKAYTRAAWTTVTPATGEDRDYTWIIITAVSAIAVLGVGIIIIKKKVLK